VSIGIVSALVAESCQGDNVSGRGGVRRVRVKKRVTSNGSVFYMSLYILYVAIGTCDLYIISTQLWSKPTSTGTRYSKKVHHTLHQDCWHLMAAQVPSQSVLQITLCHVSENVILTQYNKLYSNLIYSITWHDKSLIITHITHILSLRHIRKYMMTYKMTTHKLNGKCKWLGQYNAE